MKKRAKPNRKASRKPAAATATPDADPAMPRRAFLRTARNYGVGAVLVGGAGWFAVSEVRSARLQHDLSRIGNGTLSIVQIHDPQCPMCRDLQNETRDALGEIDPAGFQYLIANIRSGEGRDFAARHGVGHVTLLIFDGAGARVATLEGVRDRDSLLATFEHYIAQAVGG